MQYKDLSDHQLWQYCQQDDMRAYDELFNRYSPKLYKLGMRYLKDRFAVEELAVDILYSIWDKRHDLQIANLSSYLFKAMHNKAISFLRKAAPQMVNLDQVQEDNSSYAESADHNLMAEEAECSYRSKLAQLSPQRGKVFELSREYNMSYADIAKELNLSVNTVENHMVAALSYLRSQYKEKAVFTIPFILFFFLFNHLAI